MTIDHGAVKLRYFTIAHEDFGRYWVRSMQPPWRYYLVTQVYRSADDEYLCTQLLGIDLRAIKYLTRQGCEHAKRDVLSADDRERIEACFEAYARGVVEGIAAALIPPGGPPSGTVQ